MSLNYVRFDVGHHLHICHKNTLEKYPNSTLAKYVAPEFDERKSGQDYIIIDRDGKHFGSILNFMRDGSSINLDIWTDNDLTDLMREADFYCLGELVELCEQEFVQRDNIKNKKILETTNTNSDYEVPANRRLETIFGLPIMRELLQSTNKPTIIISHQNTRKFHIDAWFEELVKLCDHNKFNVYCFADKSSEAIFRDKSPSLSLRDFIVALYKPCLGNFALWVTAPTYDKFRARRGHYKCKIYKFWFVIQNQ